MPTRNCLKSFVFITAVSLTSCEGYRSVHGIVKDKTTSLPIDSVFCKALTSDAQFYTDSSGKFGLKNRMGGCVPHCKDIIIQFTKKGYKDLTLTNPTDTIFYLERQ